MRAVHKWIQVNGRNIASLVVANQRFPGQHAVMIFSGYSLAKTDTLYIMSSLAYELSNSKYFVVMVDPVGHGESDGDLSDFTLAELNMTICAVIDYLKQFIKGKIYGIGRGISAAALVEYCDNTNLDGVVAINPFIFSSQTILTLLSKEIKEHMDFSEILHSHPFPFEIKSFFRALGAEISNLNGQIISKDFLNELVTYDFVNLDSYISNKIKLIFTSDLNLKSSDKQRLDSFSKETLPYSLKVTQKIIDESLLWLKLNSEEIYDYTNAN